MTFREGVFFVLGLLVGGGIGHVFGYWQAVAEQAELEQLRRKAERFQRQPESSHPPKAPEQP